MECLSKGTHLLGTLTDESVYAFKLKEANLFGGGDRKLVDKRFEERTSEKTMPFISERAIIFLLVDGDTFSVLLNEF